MPATIDPSARARLLEKSPFGGLGEGVSRLAHLFAERRHSAGALVFAEGDPGGQFSLLASGRLRVYRTLPGGHEITVFVLQPGASFGFLPLLDGGPFPVSVASMDASVSLVLERAAFQGFLRREPEFGLRLLEYLASRLRGCPEDLAMTAAATAVGMLQIALEWAIGLERLSPLAVVAIGGLTVSTFLTLIYVPVFYDLFESMRQKLSQVGGPSCRSAAGGGNGPS